MRGFLAIELDAETRRFVRSRQEELLREGISGNYTCPENFHLTIKFLGELTEAEALQIDELTRQTAAFQEPFLLETGKLGDFKKGSKHILWLGLKPCPELLRLYGRVNAGVRPFLKQWDEGEYSPHITLVRESRHSAPVGAQGDTEGITFSAGGLSFMESKREDGKLVYVRRTFASFQSEGMRG